MNVYAVETSAFLFERKFRSKSSTSRLFSSRRPTKLFNLFSVFLVGQMRVSPKQHFMIDAKKTKSVSSFFFMNCLILEKFNRSKKRFWKKQFSSTIMNILDKEYLLYSGYILYNATVNKICNIISKSIVSKAQYHEVDKCTQRLK